MSVEDVDFGTPPYDFILVLRYNKDAYEQFKEEYPSNHKLRVMRAGHLEREEIDYLNGSGIKPDYVYIVNEPNDNEIRNFRKYARTIYE
jgi:hypothetical protein